MRRAADLYPGEAKTDKRDAFIIAGTGRTRRKQVQWLDAASDELLERLRALNGFDIDLAADQTRLTNRCRDALASVSPALERAVGSRLGHAGCGTCSPSTPRPPRSKPLAGPRSHVPYGLARLAWPTSSLTM